MAKRPAKYQRVTDAGPAPLPADVPWYVKAVLWSLQYIGLPTVFAVVFLGIFVGYIPSPITENRDETRALRKDVDHLLKYVEVSSRLHRQVCRNTAPDPAEKVECNR